MLLPLGSKCTIEICVALHIRVALSHCNARLCIIKSYCAAFNSTPIQTNSVKKQEMKPKLGELILSKKKIISAFRFGHDDMVSTELDKLHSED